MIIFVFASVVNNKIDDEVINVTGVVGVIRCGISTGALFLSSIKLYNNWYKLLLLLAW